MLIKSMIFTGVACGLTYVLCQAAQPKLCYVDLQKILREEATVLADKNLSPHDLEVALQHVKRDVQTTLDQIGRETGAVMLLAPAFGIRDVTGMITSSLLASRHIDRSPG